MGKSSSPLSVPSQNAPEKPVPLRFMMNDNVLVWRINRDDANTKYLQKQPLRQSGTFMLVRLVYKPGGQDEFCWLTLYPLYMHMAPLPE